MHARTRRLTDDEQSGSGFAPNHRLWPQRQLRLAGTAGADFVKQSV
jgi:hypothetical protein